MSYNKISRARNLVNEARESIGKIQLNLEVHGPLLILLIRANESLEEAAVILEAPPKPCQERPTLVYSRKERAA
jgi:hypothetical protein